MTVESGLSTSPRSRPSKGLAGLQRLLDVAAILAWGILLLQYWLTGKMNLLLHPDYIWLAYSAGFFLIGVAVVKLLQLLFRALSRSGQRRSSRSRVGSPVSNAVSNPVSPQHFSLFPPGWGSALLLAVALFGLWFTPQPFASQVALDRGVTETLTLTRSQPQAFRAATRPETRSLVDWIRTLNVYPEPDAYTGQKVNIDGFVIQSADFPANYLILARFIITCCAADAYPVGLPVKLSSGDRSAYPADTWLRVEGDMTTELLAGKRQLVVQAKSLKPIPKPANPYDS